jgi:hypothetical protein
MDTIDNRYTYLNHTHIHTYNSRYISQGIAEASQVFFRDAHVLPTYIVMWNYCRRDQKQAHRCLIAVYLGINAINPLVAFYNIHGRKREVLFFYLVPDITRDFNTT